MTDNNANNAVENSAETGANDGANGANDGANDGANNDAKGLIGGGYTLYTTATCTRCRVAKGVLGREGVEYAVVSLDAPENEHLIDDLKAKMGGVSMLNLPVVRTPHGKLLDGLAGVSDHFRELSQAGTAAGVAS